MIRLGVGAAVAVGYLAFTAWVSHGVLIPPEIGEYQPGWVLPAVFGAHVVAGAALGRWALVLPPAWVLLSIPAGRMYMPDIDPAIWAWALAMSAFWVPAIAFGAALGWLMRRSFTVRTLVLWVGVALAFPFYVAAVLAGRAIRWASRPPSEAVA